MHSDIKNLLQESDIKYGRTLNISPLTGGSINECYRIKCTGTDLVIKVSHNLDNFQAETIGLKTLAKVYPYIPEVYEVKSYNQKAYLILKYIEKSSNPDKPSWEHFGNNLAALHRQSSDSFGFESDNYIGSLKQDNSKESNWFDFFINLRLQPQIELAREKNLLDKVDLIHLNLFIGKVKSLFPEEPPALLHGDLWSGNYVFSTNNEAYLIDPAIYFGHREMDIAMSFLFGGFSEAFYSGYNETYPLENGWQERIEICNLYPLLVHLNLFGVSYKTQIFKTINKYI